MADNLTSLLEDYNNIFWTKIEDAIHELVPYLSKLLYKISKENAKNITFLLHHIHLYQKQKFNRLGKSTICGGQGNDILGGGSGDDIIYYDNFLFF